MVDISLPPDTCGECVPRWTRQLAAPTLWPRGLNERPEGLAPIDVWIWPIANDVLVASKVRYGVEPIRGTPPRPASGIGAIRPMPIRAGMAQSDDWPETFWTGLIDRLARGTLALGYRSYERDRWFESGSLQRRVCCEPICRPKSRLWGAGSRSTGSSARLAGLRGLAPPSARSGWSA